MVPYMFVYIMKMFNGNCKFGLVEHIVAEGFPLYILVDQLVHFVIALVGQLHTIVVLVSV